MYVCLQLCIHDVCMIVRALTLAAMRLIAPLEMVQDGYCSPKKVNVSYKY